LLFQSGILPLPLTFAEDARVLEFDIGLTNLCDRTTREAGELTREELALGAANLRQKLLDCSPGVACFNGMGIYETFLRALHAPDPTGANGASWPKRRRITPGLQPEKLGDTQLFVVPSSSGRTAAYPRQAKLGYFRQLKQLIDGLPVEAPA